MGALDLKMACYYSKSVVQHFEDNVLPFATLLKPFALDTVGGTGMVSL